MSVNPDHVLQRLAFQRGILTLLKDQNPVSDEIQKAIREIDELMDCFC